MKIGLVLFFILISSFLFAKQPSDFFFFLLKNRPHTVQDVQLIENSLSVGVTIRVFNDSETRWQLQQNKSIPSSHPVGIRIKGANITMMGSITVQEKDQEYILIVHLQVWVKQEEKMVYRLIQRKLSLSDGQPLLIFPLGNRETGDRSPLFVLKKGSERIRKLFSQDQDSEGDVDTSLFLSLEVVVERNIIEK